MRRTLQNNTRCKEENKKLLKKGLRLLDVRVNEQAVSDLLCYQEELIKWNRKINLIARNTAPIDILERHFLDSLTLLPLLDKYGSAEASLLDVGSGAGFPGMVLAVARPEFQVTLLEPRQKRVNFLRHIIRTLHLDNVEVLAERLEQTAGLTETFTFITSRALAERGRFLEMIGELSGSSGMVLLMQAREDTNPLPASWQVVENRSTKLPFSQVPRLLTLVQFRPILSQG